MRTSPYCQQVFAIPTAKSQAAPSGSDGGTAGRLRNWDPGLPTYWRLDAQLPTDARGAGHSSSIGGIDLHQSMPPAQVPDDFARQVKPRTERRLVHRATGARTDPELAAHDHPRAHQARTASGQVLGCPQRMAPSPRRTISRTRLGIEEALLRFHPTDGGQLGRLSATPRLEGTDIPNLDDPVRPWTQPLGRTGSPALSKRYTNNPVPRRPQLGSLNNG